MACRKVAAKRAEDVVVLMVDRAFDSHGFLLLGSGETVSGVSLSNFW